MKFLCVLTNFFFFKSGDFHKTLDNIEIITIKNKQNYESITIASMIHTYNQFDQRRTLKLQKKILYIFGGMVLNLNLHLNKHNSAENETTKIPLIHF